MRLITIALALGLAAITATAGAQATRNTYIVELVDPPVAAYDGNVAGMAATRPASGRRLDMASPAARTYSAYLDGKRSAAISAAGLSFRDVLHQYKVTVNGFAARMTPEQAQKLRSTAGVKALYQDQRLTLDTTRTPDFLGLRAPGGAWSKTDAQGRLLKGEGVIIGIVDGGVWPENPSVSDKVDANGFPVSSHLPGTVVYDPLPAGRFNGTCEVGQGFTAAMCNNKLVGAQYFNEGFQAAGETLWPLEYISPRDEDGHGSHTSSTAGGNDGADAVVVGNPVGRMSGIAPRARLSVYKVCFTPTLPNGDRDLPACYTSDSVAAIDTATADGVDVINFSISGSQTSFRDIVEVAFFNASFAGVFVAASAGNNGPANTVAHNNPAITTVAASTHDRFTVATVTLGNGATESGPSFQIAGLTSRPLIWSREAGPVPFASLPPVDQNALALCFNAADRAAGGASANAALDPAKVAGKIVICERGGNVLVNKSDAANAAGAAGMVLQNTPASANTTLLIAHVIPTVHLPASFYATITAYATGGTGTASFSPSVLTPVAAPVMASFSSRGPNRADPNVLKPDITGPGVDIIAAYTNQTIGATEHAQILAGTLIPAPGAEMISGTSMSSPHIAGGAALLKQAYPTWSPYAIKSALMTTTNQVVLANGAPDPDRWGYGAGHFDPNASVEPGLVYDLSIFDLVDYFFSAISGSQLNLASITSSALVGKGTLVRTVTNVGASPATYAATASVPGYAVTVTPSSLTLAPGESASYSVSLERTSAAIGAWAFGSLTWSNGATNVTSPVTVRAVILSAPSLLSETRAKGARIFTVGTGYGGTLTATGTGLVPATLTPGSVSTNTFECYDFDVPAGALHLRFATYNSETQGGGATDLDLEIYRGATFVGGSFGIDSNELVDLSSPTPATYTACVIGFQTPGNAPATFKLNSFIVGPAIGPQSLRVGAPSSVYLGATASVGVSWNVAAGQRYLGVVQYGDGTSTIGRSLVEVDGTVAALAARSPTAAVSKLAPLYVSKPTPGTRAAR